MDTAYLSYQCDLHARRDAERSREVIDVGPFRALLDRNTDLIWLNYAVPLEPSASPEATAEALVALRQLFHTRHRTLRFEFNALPWPGLPTALETAGLRRHAEHPLMICTPAMLKPVAAPGMHARLLDTTATDVELCSALAIQRVSFGGEVRETTATELAEFRAAIHDGPYLHGVAIQDDGSVIGVATLTPINDSAELVGVATDLAARRRGVAATISWFLVQTHFERGGIIAWLSAGDAIAQAVYQKIGFQLIDTRLNYIADTDTGRPSM